MTQQRLDILAFVPELLKPDQSGGDLHLLTQLSQLARNHRVALCPRFPEEYPDQAGRYRALLEDRGIRVLAGGTSDYGLEVALLERIYDAVFFKFWSSAETGIEVVRRLQPWARIIVDTGDIHFRREEGALAQGLIDAETVETNKRGELAVYREADAVLCVSDEDGQLLDEQGGMIRWFRIPLYVPMRPRSVQTRGPELLFLGGFRHSPNVDGLIWFAGEVWPAIRASVPDARLTVIGSHPPAEVAALGDREGIEVLGFVPELGPHLDRAALMVAPLRFGSGVKTKVVEAMGAELAVVTTSVGAQGLDVVSGEHLIIADEPDEFARQVVAVLGQPGLAERLGKAGRDHIGGTYSAESIGASLEGMLASITGRDRPRPVIPRASWLAKSTAFRIRRGGSRISKAMGMR